MARDPNKIAARVTFQVAGVESGHISNQFNFLFIPGSGPADSDFVALNTVLTHFYNSATGPANPVKLYFGPQYLASANSNETAFYAIDVADPHHYYGSPVSTKLWSFGSVGGGVCLPNECAAVLSYRTNYGTDPEHAGSSRPRASDRGRVYIGPLNEAGIVDVSLPSGQKFAELDPGLVTAISNSASRLFTESAAANWQWSVWSRKEQAFKAVLDKAVDAYIDSRRNRSVRNPIQTWLGLP
jgi:hypothetical protein